MRHQLAHACRAAGGQELMELRDVVPRSKRCCRTTLRSTSNSSSNRDSPTLSRNVSTPECGSASRSPRTWSAREVRRRRDVDDELLPRQEPDSARGPRRRLGHPEMRQELLDLRPLDACRLGLGVSRPARQTRAGRPLRARRSERLQPTHRGVQAHVPEVEGRAISFVVDAHGPDPRPQGADRIHPRAAPPRRDAGRCRSGAPWSKPTDA